VPITTDVVSSNLDQGDVYNIMCYSLSVTYDRSVVFFPGPPVSTTDITEILLKQKIKQTSIMFIDRFLLIEYAMPNINIQ
jgi:hypothetical protein